MFCIQTRKNSFDVVMMTYLVTLRLEFDSKKEFLSLEPEIN